jgi:hypothetical protein
MRKIEKTDGPGIKVIGAYTPDEINKMKEVKAWEEEWVRLVEEKGHLSMINVQCLVLKDIVDHNRSGGSTPQSRAAAIEDYAIGKLLTFLRENNKFNIADDVLVKYARSTIPQQIAAAEEHFETLRFMRL